MKIIAKIFCMLLLAKAAFGYIPEPKFMFREIVKNNKKSVSFRIKQTRMIYDPQYENGRFEIFEEILLKSPWQFAKISTIQDKSQMLIWDGSSTVRVIDGKLYESKVKFNIPFVYGFYLSSTKDELSSFLSHYGINPFANELSRRSDIVTMLFLSQDRSSVKLWLDNDSYRPIAFYRKDDNSELVFSEYRRFGPNIYFPMRIEKSINGTVTEKIQVSEVMPDVVLSKNLFDINYLRKKYPRAKEMPAVTSFPE
jgi:hypothetical protein